MTKSVDPDEMPHKAALHQDLHCLLRQNQSSEKGMLYVSEIITSNPSKDTMDHPDLTVSNLMENPICLKRAKGSREAAQMRWTTLAFDKRHCDKSENLICWLKYLFSSCTVS